MKLLSVSSVEGFAGSLNHEDRFRIAYSCAFLVTGVLATVVYGYRGPGVVVRIIAYVCSCATITLSVKVVFTHHDFHYPIFLTSTHLLSSLLMCCAILLHQATRGAKPIMMPTARQLCLMIVPIALTGSISVGATNVALRLAGVGFVEMISSATPLCIVLITLARGRSFDRRHLAPVLIVVVSISLCATGEFHFSVAGFILAFGAAFLRAAKSVLQGAIMAVDVEDGGYKALSPVELLACTSLPSVLITIGWSLVSEGLGPYRRIHAEGLQLSPLYWDIFLSCVIACTLNVLGLCILQDLGIVGAHVAGQLKSILVVLGGVAMLHEKVGVLQGVGFSSLMIGILWYNRVDAAIRSEGKKGAGADVQETNRPLAASQDAQKV